RGPGRGRPPGERGRIGRAANGGRGAREQGVGERSAGVAGAELEARLERDRVDTTLPGDPASPFGHLHLVTGTRREIEDVFVGLGFEVIEGPEVEFDYYNFTAVNMPAAHP